MSACDCLDPLQSPSCPVQSFSERQESWCIKNKRASACTISEHFYVEVGLVQTTPGDHNTRKYFLGQGTSENCN